LFYPGDKSPTGTYLHFCIEFGLSHYLETLIEHGAPTLVYDRDGYLALHRAVKFGDLLAVDLLLAAGVDPLAPCEDGTTMSAYCRKLQNLEMFAYLVAKKLKKPFDKSPGFSLRQACFRGSVDSVRQLLFDGADINEVSSDLQSTTALHNACLLRCEGSLRLIEFLVQQEALRYNHKNADDRTAFAIFFTSKPNPRSLSSDQKLRIAEIEKRLSLATIKALAPGNGRTFSAVEPNGKILFFNNQQELTKYGMDIQADSEFTTELHHFSFS
jgi:Ankyrin repeats (3 copies)